MRHHALNVQHLFIKRNIHGAPYIMYAFSQIFISVGVSNIFCLEHHKDLLISLNEA